MTQNNEREAFEKWYQSQFTGKVDFKRYSANPIYYDNDDIDTSWEAWEARAQSPISQNEQQEAVAFMDEDGEIYALPEQKLLNISIDDLIKSIGKNGVRLYTSPPKQAIPEWVDVDYEERRDLYKSLAKGSIDKFADLLSARLRELNAAPTNTEVGK